MNIRCIKRIPVIIFCAFFAVICFFDAFAADMNTLFNQGSIAYHDGNIIEALEKWQNGLKLADDGGNDKLGAVFAANIGLAYAALGNHDKAFQFYEKALQTNQKTGNLKNAAINMNNIGVLKKDTGNFESAVDFFSQALEIRRNLGDLRGTAKVLMNMCAAYSDAGNYKAAFQHIQDAVAVFRQIKDSKNEALALINMGLVYSDIGQPLQALETYDRALILNQSMNDKAIEAHIFEKIGTTHLQQKLYKKAVVYYQKALQLERDLNNRKGIGDLLCNLGVAYKQMGDYKEALKHYEDALSIKRFLEDRIGEGAVLGNIGLLYEQSGVLDKAHDHLIASHNICMECELPEYRWRALRGLGKIEAAKGIYDQAVVNYLLALDEIEKMRAGLAQKEMKASFMQDKMHVYDELIELYAVLDQKNPKLGYGEKSFEIFERKQGRVFIEEVGKSGARKFSGIPSDIVEEETRLSLELEIIQSALEADITGSEKTNEKEKLRNLRESETRAIQALQKVREKIKNEYPAYYALKYPQPVDLKHLQEAVLRPDELMLVYSVMDEAIFMWMIGREHFSVHRITETGKDLHEKVIAYRDNDINIFKGQTLRGTQSFGNASGNLKNIDLYPLLFPESIRQTVQTYSTVFIIPTGPLYLLPFESLKDEKGRYLIESQSFAYLSSASLLKVLRAAEASKALKPQYPFMAFANPLYEVPEKIEDPVDEIQVRSFLNIMRGNIEPLPETEDEVTQIINILKAPQNSRPLWTQQKASRSVVLDLNAKGSLDDYRYISFACHGILPDDINGVVQPSLLLSTPDPVTKEVGLLTMSDVFGLTLNAELVALSACNTGRGEIIKGEGVVGLTRAFMYAGAPSISVNLWSVETISAQKLSVEFFKALKQGKSRAQALRESKLKMIRGETGKQFQKPFFWAPMVIFGDAS